MGSISNWAKIAVVQHDDGSKSVYAELGAVDVKKGDTVNAGTKIGSPGSTGCLHFEWRGHNPYKEFYNSIKLTVAMRAKKYGQSE